MAFALARAESRDARNHRLLETGSSSSWHQFKGRLGPQHLLSLLLEDAAVRQPIPFDGRQVPDGAGRVESLTPEVAEQILEAARAQDFQQSSADYLSAQARRLGVTTRLAKAELHAVKANHQVLELPASGGQLAAHLALKHDLPFNAVFTIACANHAEQTLAGLAAMECRAVGATRILVDPDLAQARSMAFDYVIGAAPAKGGAFAERALQGLFPRATILLV